MVTFYNSNNLLKESIFSFKWEKGSFQELYSAKTMSMEWRNLAASFIGKIDYFRVKG